MLLILVGGLVTGVECSIASTSSGRQLVPSGQSAQRPPASSVPSGSAPKQPRLSGAPGVPITATPAPLPLKAMRKGFGASRSGIRVKAQMKPTPLPFTVNIDLQGVGIAVEVSYTIMAQAVLDAWRGLRLRRWRPPPTGSHISGLSSDSRLHEGWEDDDIPGAV